MEVFGKNKQVEAESAARKQGGTAQAEPNKLRGKHNPPQAASSETGTARRRPDRNQKVDRFHKFYRRGNAPERIRNV
jgi:hypothetical protein